MSEFTERVWDVVRRVPRGRVVSYGGVAAILGRPRAARGVGRALSLLPDASDVPWWRVINRNGEISIKGVPHGPALQRALLRGEGVRFIRGRVDWRRYGWDAAELDDAHRQDPPAEAEPAPIPRRPARSGREPARRRR